MNQKIELKNKSLEYYLSLRYAVSFYPDPEGGYTVLIKDLPGCMSVGETLLEAMENIEEARELWIETAFECGDEIPLPSIVSNRGLQNLVYALNNLLKKINCFIN
jgi:antitoxin HicB